MQAIHRWAVRCLAIASFVISLPASAYLQFTYTSQELPLSAAFIDGYPWDIADLGIAPVAFSLSFKVPEQDLSLKPVTHFFMDEFTFSLISEFDLLYYPLRLSPVSYGRVSLNREGDITGWNLMVTITELITAETDINAYRRANHRVDVISHAGGNLCNCDTFTNRFHPSTWHGHWIQLSLLQFDYTNSNSLGNWTIEKISVPEPGVASLMMMGLFGLFWFRRNETESAVIAV